MLRKVEPENVMAYTYVISENTRTSFSHSASFSTNRKSMRGRYARALFRTHKFWVTVPRGRKKAVFIGTNSDSSKPSYSQTGRVLQVRKYVQSREWKKVRKQKLLHRRSRSRCWQRGLSEDDKDSQFKNIVKWTNKIVLEAVELDNNSESLGL